MLQYRTRMMNDRALLSRSAGQLKHIVMICGRDQMKKTLRMAYLCFILAIVVIVASSIWGYKSGKMYTRMIPSLAAVMALLAIMQIAYAKSVFEHLRDEIGDLKMEIKNLQNLISRDKEESQD